MAAQHDHISALILRLRLAVSRAAQRDSLSWWEDEALTPGADLLLRRLFPRSITRAAWTLALLAARARHRLVLADWPQARHLFDLGAEVERQFDEAMREQDPIVLPQDPIRSRGELAQLLYQFGVMVAGNVRSLRRAEVSIMSRRVVVDWREDAEALRTRYIAERDVRRRTRLQALWLVRRGVSVTEAARVAGVGARSVERWLGWYRQGGLAAVVTRVPGHGARGAPARLSPEQQQALATQTARGVFRTCDEARQWVAAQFGIAYSYQGMYSLLARLGGHPKVPRPMAAQADPAAQAAWKKGGSPRRSPTLA